MKYDVKTENDKQLRERIAKLDKNTVGKGRWKTFAIFFNAKIDGKDNIQKQDM